MLLNISTVLIKCILLCVPYENWYKTSSSHRYFKNAYITDTVW